MEKIRTAIINILHSPTIFATLCFAAGWAFGIVLILINKNFSFSASLERRVDTKPTPVIIEKIVTPTPEPPVSISPTAPFIRQGNVVVPATPSPTE